MSTGKAIWTHDLMAAKSKELLFQTNMGSGVYSTVVPANGVLFLTNRNKLYALVK